MIADSLNIKYVSKKKLGFSWKWQNSETIPVLTVHAFSIAEDTVYDNLLANSVGIADAFKNDIEKIANGDIKAYMASDSKEKIAKHIGNLNDYFHLGSPEIAEKTVNVPELNSPFLCFYIIESSEKNKSDVKECIKTGRVVNMSSFSVKEVVPGMMEKLAAKLSKKELPKRIEISNPDNARLVVKTEKSGGNVYSIVPRSVNNEENQTFVLFPFETHLNYKIVDFSEEIAADYLVRME